MIEMDDDRASRRRRGTGRLGERVRSNSVVRVATRVRWRVRGMRRSRRRAFTRAAVASFVVVVIGEKPVTGRVWCWVRSSGSGSIPHCARARLCARSTEGGLWRSRAEIMCSPRRSRLTAVLATGWSRRLFATTRTRGTESVGATGTKVFTRRRTARSGATSLRVARSSTVGPRPRGGASAMADRSRQIPGAVQSPACRRGLISRGLRVGSRCTGCHAGCLRPVALCGGRERRCDGLDPRIASFRDRNGGSRRCSQVSGAIA
jgi:hypothetical protein